MKGLTMRPVATFFLVLTVKALTERIGINDYLPLIFDVHKYYRTSCVIFVHHGNYEDLNLTSMMHMWSREFSRQRVITVTMTFVNLLSEYNEYRKIVRPLFVIILNSKESINEFASVTKSIRPISFPIWLILFLQDPEHALEAQCKHPTYNIFNVNFNTIMLVFCYGQPILTEWYAISDNRTRTFELATWSPDSGLFLRTRKSLYGRRSDLFGEVVRVASVYESPFILLENGTVAGFLGALLLELSKVINFKMQLLDQMEAYGSWNQQTELWTGVVGQLVADQADLGVGEFSVTPHRLDVVDFTLPLIYSRNRLYIKQPDRSDVHWLGYFQAFDFKIWAVILSIIVCAPILLAIIKAKGCVTISLVMENYMHVWSIICQQGLSEFPNESSMRLAFLSIFVSSLIIQAAYSASLISFLTLPMASLPFSTVEGYVDDGSYKLIVIKNSADYDMFYNAKNFILLKMNESMKAKELLPLIEEDGFKQICEEKKVAFYTTEVLKNAVHEHCKTVFIETGKSDSIAMILRKESPYTGILNYHIRRFLDNGVMSRLKEEYLSTTNPPKVRLTQVGLRGIAPLLAMVAGGIVLGIFILMLEKAYYVFKSRRKIGLTKKRQSDRVARKPRGRNSKVNVKLPPFYNTNYYGRPIGYWP
ncbi:glutamate receptor ionotropic, delta-1-like [Harpegnathos saltator]|uniref:glutamate receptor ionotropic, delta-1-like n=1 Tax=Harpegnathos saltator TaxID=610380 RepID=UPI000948F276|nr:glutamate receptor ionotropic, delta-1-like [Harpegnathos saltator]